MKTKVRGAALYLMVFGVALLPAVACGSDSGSGNTGDKSTAKGTGGESSKPETGGAAGAAGASDGVGCGEKICMPVDGVTGAACCKDAFQSTCGIMSAMGTCIDAPKPPPKGCPSVAVMAGVNIDACCTTDGKCGVDLTMFGQGCIDVVTAAMMAQQMGVPIMGMTPTEASCTPGDGGA